MGHDSVTVSVPDKATLFEDLGRRLDVNQGFSVATLNLDHVVKLSKDTVFRAAYATHTHITADGNPIVWLSRLAGQRHVMLTPGSELIAPLAGIAAQKGAPIALFGATEQSLQEAAQELIRRNPDLQVVLTLAPPMGFDPGGADAEAAIARIKASGAKIVFVALGAPKQEKFVAKAQCALPETGFLSIGAGLDFLSGAQQRAPRFARALAAEWLWRLLGDPYRLAARYGACLIALPGLILRALAIRTRRT